MLLVLALLIAVAFFWINSYYTSRLRTEKERDLEKWSQTITKKAELVKLTNETFESKKRNEQWKAQLWVRATEELQKELPDYSLSSYLRENISIPLILVDADNNYSGSFHLGIDQESPGFEDSIQRYIQEWPKTVTPLELEISGFQLKIIYNYSLEYYQLSARRDSLIESFNEDLTSNTGLVPFVFMDSTSNEVLASNLDKEILNDTSLLQNQISDYQQLGNAIKINLGQGNRGIIYHAEDPLLKQIRYFPYIQIGIVTVFIFLGYLLFSTFRRAEQNQVWAGMAKETAHQLGTPLSSLMAWIELLKSQGVEDSTVQEMNKDIDRLQTITDRFSKIGSETKLENLNVNQIVNDSVDYLKKRISSKVELTLPNTEQYIAKVNKPLFEWVIENLTKNAVDAMEGAGKITYHISERAGQICIDISDTGKGIPSKQLKTVFEPGFSTKKRGWGLGLSLAKRIIENYHEGKIFVLESELNEGTTFRILLQKA